MNIDVKDLRRGDRFNLASPMQASFNGVPVEVLNLALGGLQILHPEAIKLGLRGRVIFAVEDIGVNVVAHVMWSRLSQVEGRFLYSSGLRLDGPDPSFAHALNTLIRYGAASPDRESMDRKRALLIEKELRRAAKPRVIPTSGAIQ